MEEHPAHAKWVKDTIEPRFWSKFESLAAYWHERVGHTASVSVSEDKRDIGGQTSWRAPVDSALDPELLPVRDVERSSGYENKSSTWASSAGDEMEDAS